MVTVAASSLALAQDHNHAPAPSRNERPVVHAVRVDKAPAIDGQLDEAVWTSVPKIDGFTQQEPQFGEPATERTEVGVAYDSQHLYISVHAYDSDPSGIIATEMRR